MLKTGERVICRFHVAANDDSSIAIQRRNRVCVARYFPYMG